MGAVDYESDIPAEDTTPKKEEKEEEVKQPESPASGEKPVSE